MQYCTIIHVNKELNPIFMIQVCVYQETCVVALDHDSFLDLEFSFPSHLIACLLLPPIMQ